jgi:bacillithiol system protein YtxJ
MKWTELQHPGQLEKIDALSRTEPVLIFKHSTRCFTSADALDRLEREWEDAGTSLRPFFLDVLQHRDISSAIAERYGVKHESPQALVIRNGECVRSQSHMKIRVKELEEAA